PYDINVICNVTGSTHNLSNLSDAPGANSINSAVVRFVDEENEDYRLSLADTAANGVGVDLTTDPDGALNITDDINGIARVAPFDLGASTPQSAVSPIARYRSVGPGSTSALASGGATTMDLKGSIVTFSAAMPDKVGVGDVLEYDAD